MPQTAPFSIRQLTASDVALLRETISMFAAAFDEADTYLGAPPSDAYLEELLRGDRLIALAALRNGAVVGGLAAYELPKFERERSEIYIYDLAVAAAHRRRGIATGLIAKLKSVAASRGAHVIFVQADRGDEPAIALYSKLGVREAVLHFDIEPD